MTTMTTERETDRDESSPEERPTLIELVHKIHDELELPEGYTAQIIKGQLVIMATPGARHAYIVGEIEDALRVHLPAGLRTYQHTTGREPDGDRYVPDLGIWPKALVLARGEPRARARCPRRRLSAR
jgi:Uma2 family endonuclease